MASLRKSAASAAPARVLVGAGDSEQDERREPERCCEQDHEEFLNGPLHSQI